MINYSIIIPHYNIPHLLRRCINSIPYREDIQIIVVDDCSKNFTEVKAVIKDCSSKRKIELLTSHEGGSAGRARNIGLKHAVGKWIIFADADDYFECDISVLLNKYQSVEDIDVVFFDYRSVMSDDINIVSNRKDQENHIKNFKINNDETYFRFEFHAPWAKIIRRDLIETKKITFDETRYANDAMFATKVGCYASSIKIEDIYGYVLTTRDDSLCSNFFQKPGEALIRTKVALRVRKQIKDCGFVPNSEYITFLRILLWNKEFKGLREIYESSQKYDLSQKEIREIIKSTGKRYYPIALWLLIISKLKR